MKEPTANLRMLQGRTFRYEFRWSDDYKIYRPIQDAARTAPARLTVPNHGLLEGWSFNVTGAKGMTAINRPDPREPWRATVVDQDTLEINALNAANLNRYAGGGWVEYFRPVDLAGYSAHMQVRPEVGSAEVLLDLDSDTGGIVIDNAQKRITVSVSAGETAALDFEQAVYDLEMISAAGDIELLARGVVQLVKEVTRQ